MNKTNGAEVGCMEAARALQDVWHFAGILPQTCRGVGKSAPIGRRLSSAWVLANLLLMQHEVIHMGTMHGSTLPGRRAKNLERALWSQNHLGHTAICFRLLKQVCVGRGQIEESSPSLGAHAHVAHEDELQAIHEPLWSQDNVS